MPGYDIRIDWNNNGSFEDPGEDLSIPPGDPALSLGRVLATSPLQIQYGRDQMRALSPPMPGTLNGLEVNNISGDYSPENSASPLASNLKPGRPIWVSYNDRSNLVPNPSFETGITGWSSPSNRCTLLQDAGQFQSGTKSLRATVASVSGTPTVNSQRFPVSGRKTYTVSYYDRLGVSGSRFAGVKMIFYDSAGGIVLNPSTVFTSSAAGVWTRRSATHIAPATATQADVIIGYSPATVADIHYIDAVMVEEGSALGAYFDGSTGGGAFWRTTAHASASIIGYVLYRGFTDDFQLNPDRLLPTVSFTGLDGLGRLRDTKVSTEVFAGIRTGTAVHKILDAVSWPADKRDIDTGATQVAFWWAENADSYEALKQIVNSEGPGSLVSIGADGTFIFRDRHHRLIRTASTTVQATFRDTGTEPVYVAPVDYLAGFKDVVNSCVFEVDERIPRPRTVVWQTETDDTISVPGGTPYEIIASATDPFMEAIAPTASAGDFTVLSGTVSASITRTSGQATTIVLTSAAGATITGLRLQARPIVVARTVKVEVEDAASVAEHGRRSYGEDAPWAGKHDALAIGELVVNQRAQRLPTVTITVRSKPEQHATRFATSMARDLSDRVRIIEPSSGMDANFFLERIGHAPNWKTQTHDVILGCEKVVANPADASSTVFVLNSATNGVLNTNRLGH